MGFFGMNTETAYTTLLERLKRLDRLGSIGSLLGWDESVNLPPQSSGLRGEQSAVFTEILHRESADPRLGELISQLEADQDQLDPPQRAVIRDARKNFDRLTRIPAEFAARKAKAASAGYQAWVEARKTDNFAHFKPFLEEQLAFAIEETSFLEVKDPYDYWIDHFDPGMTRPVVESLFDALLPELKDILASITACPDQPDNSIFKGFPVDQQDAFLREVVGQLGFDFNHGRIDTAVHPFCGGHPLDTRMTTRYDVDNPLDSISSSIHETGHALYEQGLDDRYAGSALGEAVGMAVHESQSRLWENQVGRSLPFWKHFEPSYREAFASQLEAVSFGDLYRAINKVEVTPIRVDADEVTYNLHIMLRFDLEKRLFDGSLSVADLPEAWRETSERILGFTPRNDAEGCLQDIHWSQGGFGYFPSYCLGNILAAQLWYRLREDLPDLDADIGAARFKPLLDWLRKNIHSKGRLLYTNDFAKAVTGMELSHAPLVRYLRERYLPLYSAS
jgi:carboxypeptidase Taq